MIDKEKQNAEISGPQFDPRLLTVMHGMPTEEKIDLLEYWRTIWKNRLLIIGVSFVVALLAAAYSLALPNIYRAEVVVAPVGEDDRGQFSLGGMRNIASIAGISLGGGRGDVKENLAVLETREFLWAFIKENKLKPILFEAAWNSASKSWHTEEPTQWEAYRALHGILSVSADKQTGLVTVAVEWKDADLAAQWANGLVTRLNAHLRGEALERSKKTLGYLNEELGKVKVAEMRQALFDLISQEQKKAMLASTQKEFAFRVLDAAIAPDLKAKPKRSLIVILYTLLAGVLIVTYVLLREGMVGKNDSIESGNDARSDREVA